MNKPHTYALSQARQAGRTLARAGESRAYVNDVARTLPVDEADALLAGYYAALRERQAKADKREPRVVNGEVWIGLWHD